MSFNKVAVCLHLGSTIEEFGWRSTIVHVGFSNDFIRQYRDWFGFLGELLPPIKSTLPFDNKVTEWWISLSVNKIKIATKIL